MPVNLTNMDIGTRYALQEDFDNGFVGRDRQVVIQTDDPKGYRPVIMDGQTTGGKSKVALVADLTDYLTKNNPTFTGTLSGANGTFTGTLSLNGDSVATQSDVDTLEANVVKTTEQTLTEEQQTQSLRNQGVIQAIEELVEENGGTVSTLLSETSTTSAQNAGDPWADLN